MCCRFFHITRCSLETHARKKRPHVKELEKRERERSSCLFSLFCVQSTHRHLSTLMIIYSCYQCSDYLTSNVKKHTHIENVKKKSRRKITYTFSQWNYSTCSPAWPFFCHVSRKKIFFFRSTSFSKNEIYIF